MRWKNATFVLMVAIAGVVVVGHGQPVPPSMFQVDPGHSGRYEVDPALGIAGVTFAFRTNGPVRSTPAYSEGKIFFGSGDGNLYAIDSHNGRQVWNFRTDGAVHSSPAVKDGSVFFTSRDGNLYALDANTGKERWKFQMGSDLPYHNGFDYYLSSPTLVGNNLYV
ncbi:MAG TPA: PQQ-binding-like beta-propeller repeat protein, partial [Bacteroidota bacterium]|nr:PQQ-binding-like beta-propeller repeat protein [Bacteroidota bacterium]